jgi:mono/diheme cytochrome c family protein
MNGRAATRTAQYGLGTFLLAASLVVWATPLAAQVSPPAAYDRGKALYQGHCAVCHGGSGNADTPVGRLLKPQPRNFADPVEMARVTVDRIYRAIKDGRAGTAMAAWGRILTETEIGDVIDYIHTLTVTPPRPLSAEQLSVEVGRRLYLRECASCHGADGQANTAVAKVLDPPPRNFVDPIGMARLDDGRIYMAIYRGRPGTAMGGHGELLSPLEIIDVIRYVRTLVRPAGMTPAQLDTRVGGQIYRQHCVACHGENGDAQTPLAQALTRRPRDFTRSREMASLSDEAMAQAIMHGAPGSAMAPWEGVLNKDDIRRVILFIRQTFAGSAALTR